MKRLTSGKGVDVVYDGVGKATFEKNLNVMRLRGMLVLVWDVERSGAAGGSSEAIGEGIALHGAHDSGALHCNARGTFGPDQRAVQPDRAGKTKGAIAKKYPLAEAPQAHRDMEARKVAGKLLLVP